MSPRRTLDVFLHGKRIGELKGNGLKLSFQYDRAALAEYGAGSILLRRPDQRAHCQARTGVGLTL